MRTSLKKRELCELHAKQERWLFFQPKKLLAKEMGVGCSHSFVSTSLFHLCEHLTKEEGAVVSNPPKDMDLFAFSFVSTSLKIREPAALSTLWAPR